MVFFFVDFIKELKKSLQSKEFDISAHSFMFVASQG